MQASSSGPEERNNDLLLQARRKPRVEGVCFDRFSKRWVAKRAGGKKVYFPVYKYGFHRAYELAVHTRKKSEGDLGAVTAVRSAFPDATQHETLFAAVKSRRDQAMPRCIAARRTKPFPAAGLEESRKTSPPLAVFKQRYRFRDCTVESPVCERNLTGSCSATTTPRVVHRSAHPHAISDEECTSHTNFRSPGTGDFHDTVVSTPDSNAVASTATTSAPCHVSAKGRSASQVGTLCRSSPILAERRHHGVDSLDGLQRSSSSPEGKDDLNVCEEAGCKPGLPAAETMYRSVATEDTTADSAEFPPDPDAHMSSQAFQGCRWSETCSGSSQVCCGVGHVTPRKRSAHCSEPTCLTPAVGRTVKGGRGPSVCEPQKRNGEHQLPNPEPATCPSALALHEVYEKEEGASVVSSEMPQICTLADNQPVSQGHKTATIRQAEPSLGRFTWTDISQECPEQSKGEALGSQPRRRPALRRSSRLVSGAFGWQEPQRRVCSFAPTVQQRATIDEDRRGRTQCKAETRCIVSNCHADYRVNGSHADAGGAGLPTNVTHPCALEEECLLQKAASHGGCEGALTTMVLQTNGFAPSLGNPHPFDEGRLPHTAEVLVKCLLLIMDDLATLCIPGIFGRFSEDGYRRLQAIQQHRAILEDPDNFPSVLPAYFRLCWPLLNCNMLPHETEVEKVRKLLGGLHQVALACKLLFPAYPLQGELDNREGPYALNGSE